MGRAGSRRGRAGAGAERTNGLRAARRRTATAAALGVLAVAVLTAGCRTEAAGAAGPSAAAEPAVPAASPTG
ncbi:hypothetical protein ABZ371_02815, partial [Streptomyces sp. NPDC005899]